MLREASPAAAAPAASAAAAASQQSQEDSVKEQLRRLNEVYRWDRLQRSEPSPSSPARARRNPATNGSVTIRSSRRRRRRMGVDALPGYGENLQLLWSAQDASGETQDGLPTKRTSVVGATDRQDEGGADNKAVILCTDASDVARGNSRPRGAEQRRGGNVRDGDGLPGSSLVSGDMEACDDLPRVGDAGRIDTRGSSSDNPGFSGGAGAIVSNGSAKDRKLPSASLACEGGGGGGGIPDGVSSDVGRRFAPPRYGAGGYVVRDHGDLALDASVDKAPPASECSGENEGAPLIGTKDSGFSDLGEPDGSAGRVRDDGLRGGSSPVTSGVRLTGEVGRKLRARSARRVLLEDSDDDGSVAAAAAISEKSRSDYRGRHDQPTGEKSVFDSTAVSTKNAGAAAAAGGGNARRGRRIAPLDDDSSDDKADPAAGNHTDQPRNVQNCESVDDAASEYDPLAADASSSGSGSDSSEPANTTTPVVATEIVGVPRRRPQTVSPEDSGDEAVAAGAAGGSVVLVGDKTVGISGQADERVRGNVAGPVSVAAFKENGPAIETPPGAARGKLIPSRRALLASILVDPDDETVERGSDSLGKASRGRCDSSGSEYFSPFVEKPTDSRGEGGRKGWPVSHAAAARPAARKPTDQLGALTGELSPAPPSSSASSGCSDADEVVPAGDVGARSRRRPAVTPSRRRIFVESSDSSSTGETAVDSRRLGAGAADAHPTGSEVGDADFLLSDGDVTPPRARGAARAAPAFEEADADLCLDAERAARIDGRRSGRANERCLPEDTGDACSSPSLRSGAGSESRDNEDGFALPNPAAMPPRRRLAAAASVGRTLPLPRRYPSRLRKRIVSDVDDGSDDSSSSSDPTVARGGRARVKSSSRVSSGGGSDQAPREPAQATRRARDGGSYVGKGKSSKSRCKRHGGNIRSASSDSASSDDGRSAAGSVDGLGRALRGIRISDAQFSSPSEGGEGAGDGSGRYGSRTTGRGVARGRGRGKGRERRKIGKDAAPPKKASIASRKRLELSSPSENGVLAPRCANATLTESSCPVGSHDDSEDAGCSSEAPRPAERVARRAVGHPDPAAAAPAPEPASRPSRRPRRAGGGKSGGAEASVGGWGEDLSGPAFFRARDSLTAKYFVEFNEGAFGGALSDVKVVWSQRLNSTAGVTKSLRRANALGGFDYLSTVELSCKVLDSEPKLRETLLHELCHAAAWVVDHKSKPPHGDHFWMWANRAKAAHPGVPVTTCHSYEINYKYRYVCVGSSAVVGGGDGGGVGVGCGAEIGRHSKSIDVVRQVCGRCKGRLMLFGTHGKDGKLKKPRTANGFSLFVKEHYAGVKGSMPAGTRQQEVMKEISKLWAARRDGKVAGGGAEDSAGIDGPGKSIADRLSALTLMPSENTRRKGPAGKGSVSMPRGGLGSCDKENRDAGVIDLS